MDYNFKNYKLFCYDFNLNPSYWSSLMIFKRYCEGDYDIIFSLI